MPTCKIFWVSVRKTRLSKYLKIDAISKLCHCSGDCAPVKRIDHVKDCRKLSVDVKDPDTSMGIAYK